MCRRYTHTVATLLRNCDVAMYGSETSYYFNVSLPTHFLEKYMRVPGYKVFNSILF